jgi:hypothetical protein
MNKDQEAGKENETKYLQPILCRDRRGISSVLAQFVTCSPTIINNAMFALKANGFDKFARRIEIDCISIAKSARKNYT